MIFKLCERFPAFSPLSLRRERAREVFVMIVEFTKYSRREARQAKKQQVIRKPAGDSWF